MDEELDRYLYELGFVEDQEDEQGEEDVNGNFRSSAAGQNDWLMNGTADGLQQSQFTSGRLSRSGVRLLDILSNIHAYLRAVLPASFKLDTPPTVIGASSVSAGFELATLKYFDQQHNAYQYNLSDVYSSCLMVGLSAKDAYSETRTCLEWNIITGVLGCAKQAFDSWKQTVEVVLLNSSEVLIKKSAPRFEGILLSLLQTLLQKLVAPEEERTDVATGSGAVGSSLSIWIALGEELSSLSLTVIAKLREVLQYSAEAPHLGLIGSGTSPRSTQLHSILSLLVSAILNTRHSATRIYLYAIFLNYILYAKERNEFIERNMRPAVEAAERDPDMQSTWLSIQQEQLRLDAQNLSLLSSHNMQLLQLVVNDALDGSSKLKGLSFSLSQHAAPRLLRSQQPQSRGSSHRRRRCPHARYGAGKIRCRSEGKRHAGDLHRIVPVDIFQEQPPAALSQSDEV